jgi:hypothetical protein
VCGSRKQNREKTRREYFLVELGWDLGLKSKAASSCVCDIDKDYCIEKDIGEDRESHSHDSATTLTPPRLFITAHLPRAILDTLFL